MENFKLGDIVYDEVNHPNQKGVVLEISEEEDRLYLMQIDFDNAMTDWYTLHGSKFNSNIKPTLSHTPYKVILEGFSQERPKVLTDEMKVCIKGDGTTEYGKNIIEKLKSLGGKDTEELSGNSSCYYFIRQNFIIDGEFNIPQGYKEITLKDEVEQEFKVGTILVAIDECKMICGDKMKALIKGKEYPIKTIDIESLYIESELSKTHGFPIKDYKKYFKIKDEQVCYVGKKIEYNGSILLIVQQDKDTIDVIFDGKQEVIMISNIINGTYRIID